MERELNGMLIVNEQKKVGLACFNLSFRYSFIVSGEERTMKIISHYSL